MIDQKFIAITIIYNENCRIELESWEKIYFLCGNLQKQTSRIVQEACNAFSNIIIIFFHIILHLVEGVK